jgi:hypothetical protein
MDKMSVKQRTDAVFFTTANKKALIKNAPKSTLAVFTLTDAKPAKLDAKNLAVIITLIKAGNHIDTAAQTVGIGSQLIKRYLSIGHDEYETVMQQLENEEPGEESDVQLSIYAQLYVNVLQAQAYGQAECVEKISKAGMFQWQAAAWLLERRHGKQWGRPATTATTKEVKHTIRTTAPVIKRVRSDDEFLALTQQQTEIQTTIKTVEIKEQTRNEFDET